jgi:hypothetical protein
VNLFWLRPCRVFVGVPLRNYLDLARPDEASPDRNRQMLQQELEELLRRADGVKAMLPVLAGGFSPAGFGSNRVIRGSIS